MKDVGKARVVPFMLLGRCDDNCPARRDSHQSRSKYGSAVLITRQRSSAYVMVGNVFSICELKLNSISLSQYTHHNFFININRLTLNRASNAFIPRTHETHKFRLQMQSFLTLNLVAHTVSTLKFKG